MLILFTFDDTSAAVVLVPAWLLLKIRMKEWLELMKIARWNLENSSAVSSLDVSLVKR